MTEVNELTEQLNELGGQMKAALAVLEDQKADMSRRREADESVKKLAADLTEVKDKINKAEFEADQAKTVADMKAMMESIRTPSRATQVGTGPVSTGGFRPDFGEKAQLIADRFYGGDQSKLGTIITAIGQATARDAEEQGIGKAALQGLGFTRQGAASSDYHYIGGDGKATLGSTGPTGGYVLPNNLVDTLVKPNTQAALYTDGSLLTVRSGVNVRGVDMPYRTGAPARMTVQTWGQGKENLDETYGTYTASLVTVARIYDVGKQYLRFSAGSAEEDVMDELSKAAALGENYYVINGNGTAGNNGEPYGIVPAIQAGNVAYTTAFTPAAAPDTIAGSMARLLAKMAGALASRTQPTTAFVVNAADYWTMASQGTDTAGFFFAPAGGPLAIRPGTLLTPWGIPVYHDANLTSKYVIAGNWPAAKFFRGLEFRVDVSDQAGSRWDDNLVGYRGEEEIGFNAATAVSVGAFQLCTTALV